MSTLPNNPNTNKHSNSEPCKALFIGNALCDVEITASNKILQQLNLQSGSMTLVGEEKKDEVQNAYQKNIVKRSSGGSAANSAYHLSSSNTKVGFIGSIASDENGKAFAADFAKKNIAIIGQQKQNAPTGSCSVLCTPDGERTMLTYLGCATDISDDVHNLLLEISSPQQESFKNETTIFFIEGYVLDGGKNSAAVAKLTSAFAARGSLIAISASDASYIKIFPQAFKEMLAHCHLLFCNAEELLELCKVNSPALQQQQQAQQSGEVPNTKVVQLLEEHKNFLPQIIVCTNGGNGCHVLWQGKTMFTPAKKVNVVDATGAGDAFAAEMLRGILGHLEQQHSLSTSEHKLNQLAKISDEALQQILENAHSLSAKIISRYGSR